MDKFSKKLLDWYKINKRQLPWRNSNNPYYVWISEIILQQTKVSTGLKYFNTFVSKYPTISDLSKSTEEEVLLIWQGLGYYSRAINILKTAKVVTNKYDGIFPNVYNDLIKLPGIGDYTASAILSICFNKPYPVIDGNVYRVLSRYFDVNQPINKHASKKIFHDLAKSTLDLKNPGDYNEALMEFGALNCKPLKPLCHTCVLNEKCLSFKKNIVSLRPVKVQKKQKKVRFFNYLVPFDLENNTIIIKREDNDIWKGLYEFPLIETSKTLNSDDLICMYSLPSWAKQDGIFVSKIYEKTHYLTHQELRTVFWLFRNVNHKFNFSLNSLRNYPLPKIIVDFLDNLVL